MLQLNKTIVFHRHAEPVAAIGDRGEPVDAMAHRGCRAACIALLVVLQSYADNIQPLQATLTGPDAVLVNSTNGFMLSITGGERPYLVEWWQHGHSIGCETVQWGTTIYRYVAPNNPQHETLTAIVDDSRPEMPREITVDKQFWQVKFDVDVDANYDGTIDDNDENVETSQGGLIALNHDDDNRSGQADVSETAVQNENDLCLVTLTLAPANIAGSTLTLSAPAGGSRMRVWSTVTKSGTPLSLPYEWQPGAQPQQVYVEGISPSVNLRDCGLKLSFAKETTTLNDEITLGVVKVGFENRSDTAYGFDDGSLAYPAPVPRDYSPQKYSWVSVQNGNGQTKIDAKITPAVYANSVFFTVDDTAKAACSPTRAATSPQLLTFTGKGSALKSQTFLRANLGSLSGPLAGRLNVAVYENTQYRVEFHKVSTATLVPDGTTWQQFRHGANMFLSRGVAELDGTSGNGLTVEYDTNTNGFLDFYLFMANFGEEWQAMLNAIRPQGDANHALHVKPAIRLHYRSGTALTAVGLIVHYADYQLIVVTDACTSKAVTLCHEVLHGAGLNDVGPPGHNTRNLMYADNGMTYHLGWFPVELHNTQGTASGTENQWETIRR